MGYELHLELYHKILKQSEILRVNSVILHTIQRLPALINSTSQILTKQLLQFFNFPNHNFLLQLLPLIYKQTIFPQQPFLETHAGNWDQLLQVSGIL
jgi:hypothetical protein